MRASIGDRMVVASARLDGPLRDGEIMSTGVDGAPPYHVRWADSGAVTVFFPGPDAHVQHFGDSAGSNAPAQPVDVAGAAEAGTAPHVKSWRIDLYLYEGQHTTSAQAVLHGDTPAGLKSLAVARRRPEDPDVPEIGDEVAAGRALRRLADLLLGAAADDLSGIVGHQVEIPS